MLSMSSKLGLNAISRKINTRLFSDAATIARRSTYTLDNKLTRLDAEVRRSGRVAAKDVTDMFEKVKTGTGATSTQALMLIRCCGTLLSEETPENRNKLVDDVWKVFQMKGINLDISHYNALLKVYLENESDFNPLVILKEIESAGFEPNRVTYQRLIHRYCQLGDIEGATKILEFMKTKEIPLTEAVFNSLILGYGKSGDLEAARGTLGIMKSAGVEASSDTYVVLLQVFGEASLKNPSLAKTIDDLLDEAKRSDVVLSDVNFLEVIKHIGSLDGIQDPTLASFVDKFLSFCAKAPGYNHDCSNVILHLIGKKKVDLATKLYDTMESSQNFSEYQSAGMFFISQMVRTGVEPSKVFEICQRFKKSGANIYSFHKAAEVAIEYHDLETTKQYIRRFVEENDDKALRVTYFWPLLAKSHTTKELLDVLKNDMGSLSFTMSSNALLETFTHYVWPKVPAEEYTLFINSCKELEYSSAILVTSLLEHLLRTDNVNGFWQIARSTEFGKYMLFARNLVLEIAGFHQRTGDSENTCNILRHALKYSGQGKNEDDWAGRFLTAVAGSAHTGEKELVQLIRKMVDLKLFISQEAADRIKQRSSINEKHLVALASEKLKFTYEDDDLAKPMDSMSLEELENLYTELKSKNKGVRGVIRKLIINYQRIRASSVVKDEDTDAESMDSTKKSAEIITKVNQLLSDPDSEPLSDAMRACLMHIYITHANDVDKAMKFRRAMAPDFNLDYFKILSVTKKLVENKRIDEAFDYLNKEIKLKDERNARALEANVQHSRDMKEMSYASERNIFGLLNAVAEVTKDKKRVKEFFDKVYEFLDFLEPSNVTCGPLVKVHLLNDDVNGALEVFLDCCSRYKASPWKQELMKIFIESEDSEKLQLVTDQSIKVYGESNTLFDLAMSFLFAGRSKQAKKIVTTPGLRLFERRTSAVLQRLVKEKNIAVVADFVRITRESFGVNRDEAYYEWIRCAVACNDPDKALEAWTDMQEEGVIPSNRILRTLGLFLQRSGQTPPFEIPADEGGDKAVDEQIFARKMRSKSLSGFLDAVREGDTKTALALKKQLALTGESINLGQECMLIEKLLKNGSVEVAADMITDLVKSGRYPFPKIMRDALIHMSKAGMVTKINELAPYFPDEFKNQSWYTNQLTEAYVKANKVDKFIDEVLPTLRPFPLGGMFNILDNKPDMEPKLRTVAERFATEENYVVPLGMIWQHYMKQKRYSEANTVFEKHPTFRKQLHMNNLIEHIRYKADVETARELVDTIRRSDVVPRVLGIGYSAYIDALVEQNKLEECEKLVVEEIIPSGSRVNSETGETIPAVTLKDMNRMALVRLALKIKETLGREPRFEIPERGPSVSTESAPSADEEVRVQN